MADTPIWTTDTHWSTSPRRTPFNDKVRVHPYGGPLWVATPRDEVKPIHPRKRRYWPCRRLSDLEVAAIILALIGLALHIAAMATPYWASYNHGETYNVGIFPQCQYKHGCLPVGPVGCAAIVSLLYGVSVPILFTIYTTCCWRRYGGKYVEYATTANCFVAVAGVLGALLMTGFRLWGFPIYDFQLDYSFYLDLAAGVCFLVAGILFLVHVCLQWD